MPGAVDSCHPDRYTVEGLLHMLPDRFQLFAVATPRCVKLKKVISLAAAFTRLNKPSTEEFKRLSNMQGGGGGASPGSQQERLGESLKVSLRTYF